MSYAIATSTVDTRALIKPIIEAAWVSLGYSAGSIEWPNENFVKDCSSLSSGAWMRVSYTDQTSNPSDYGGGVVHNETLCVLQLQIFAPKNMGTSVLYVAADKFRSTLERQSFGNGVRFRSVQGPSRIDDSVWAGVLLNLPFEFLEDIPL
jgi:hypothetical protein